MSFQNNPMDPVVARALNEIDEELNRPETTNDRRDELENARASLFRYNALFVEDCKHRYKRFAAELFPEKPVSRNEADVAPHNGSSFKK